MKKAAVFAGTTEGRILCRKLCEKKIPVTAFVATDYGEEVMQPNEYLTVMKGRLSEKGMEDILVSYEVVLDATHPYATEVTQNIKSVCSKLGKPCLRVLRECADVKDAVCVNSIQEAAEYLNKHEGNALLTTGSKELEPFNKVKDYQERLTVRVLPTIDSILACNMAGFQGKQVIAMQGPFSADMNQIQLKELKASYLVTKESGVTGGFREKSEGAKLAGAKLIVVNRPAIERGASVEETVKQALKFLG